MAWKLPFCLQNLSHPHACAPACGCASGTKGDVHRVFLKLVEAGEGGRGYLTHAAPSLAPAGRAGSVTVLGLNAV